MFTALFLAAASLGAVGDDLPAYVLDVPGIAFGALPPEMAEPVEGTLDESSGSVQSPPNATGTEYRIHYWREELAASTRKADWLVERLRTVISPDLLPHLLLGTPDWIEGSMLSPYRETASIGLVPVVNFNFVAEDGAVTGIGRAAAIFRDGYSTLFYTVTSPGSGSDVRTALDTILANAWMVTD